ncbi:mucin-15-like isoform X1 [Hoplias malabaricus]|uniref:mucin-15-like isoform X1 n=2 Tax=Hoplias malabaricus TaxID=27720 RepID=UPI00346245AE
MKLLLGLGFAAILILQSFQEVPTQNLTNEVEFTSGYNLFGFNSGDSEDPTALPVESKEPENDTDSLTTVPTFNAALNFSTEVFLNPNETSTQEDNTSSTVTPGPDLTTLMTTETDLNSTDAQQPTINSTAPTTGNFTSNETAIDSFDNQNTTTGINISFTTAQQPHTANTSSNSYPTSSNGTIQTTTSQLPTTVSTTVQLTESGSQLNRSGGSLDVRDNVQEGVGSDIKQKANNQPLGVVLGIAVAVGFVAVVAYVIMKQRNHRDFSHRKLVEDVPPDPVHRLDHGEPLDLKSDGSAYYNPGLQGDNIQMTSFPRGHSN